MFNNFKKPILVSCLLATVAAGVVGSILAVSVAQAAPDFGPYFSINTKTFNPGQDLTAIRAKSELQTAQISDPAGIHFGDSIQSSKVALQNVGEFTNVFPPVKALEMARFKEGGPQVASATQHKPGYGDVSEFTTAYQYPVPIPLRSALADVSSETIPHTPSSVQTSPMRSALADVSSETIAHTPSSVQTSPMRSALADISSETNPHKLLLIEVVSYQNSPAIKVQHVRMKAKSCEALDVKLDHMHLKPSVESARLAKVGCAKFEKSI